HFMRKIVEDKRISEDIRVAAEKVIKVLNEYVMDNNVRLEFHGSKFPEANGVSIELPLYRSINYSYQKTSFSQNSKWDEFVNKLKEIIK
ncbi:MAG: hypothetical protein ACK4GJ_02140, partial [bacterium]